MAIKLEVRDYCAECCDFEAVVTKPERTTMYSNDSQVIEVLQTDTVVRCKYANRCASLVRYLTRQNKEGVE